MRFADFRDVDDGPYDAISSIGMFEHVGLSELDAYFTPLPLAACARRAVSSTTASAVPSTRGRCITTAGRRGGSGRNFTERYVFPDGELHEIGNVVSAIQRAGFEARHMESLREHYALTLRCWVRNLEDHWDDAVAEVGHGRARVWRLYMAAAAVGFEHDDNQVHQVLATATTGGDSGMPRRPQFT